MTASGSNCPLPMRTLPTRGLRDLTVDPACSTVTKVTPPPVPPVPPLPPVPPTPPTPPHPVRPLPPTGVELPAIVLLASLCTGLAVLLLAAAGRRRRG